MSRMVRKQIVLEPEQERALAERAALLGVSQSQLVRDAIDAMLGLSSSAHKERVWDELFASMRGEDGRPRWGSGGLRWTREELHER